MKQVKVVAFDCDGVLFDSEKANRAYYNQILKHLEKPPMDAEQFAYAHMHTAEEALAYLFADKKSFEAARAYRKTMPYIPFIKYMEIEPYLKTLLNRLRPRYKTAIATNRTDTMQRVLREHTLEMEFDLVVSAQDVARPKPHPDSLLKILEYFEIEARSAIYVGDSKLDELAAEAAGIPLVAYRNSELAAAYHIESLKELEQILAI